MTYDKKTERKIRQAHTKPIKTIFKRTTEQRQNVQEKYLLFHVKHAKIPVNSGFFANKDVLPPFSACKSFRFSATSRGARANKQRGDRQQGKRRWCHVTYEDMASATASQCFAHGIRSRAKEHQGRATGKTSRERPKPTENRTKINYK